MVRVIAASPAFAHVMRRSAQVLAYLLVTFYVVCASYLCAIAVAPRIQSQAPPWRHWFGAPGSWLTIAVVLLVPILALACSRFAGRKAFSTTPLLILAAMAVSAVAFGLSSYWNCHDKLSSFFSPVSWTVGLFLGAYEDRYKDSFCGRDAAVPVALELARLLALATTLTTAIAAARTLFRSQFDRIAIFRARSLTAVVGIDEDTLSMLSAIASRMGKRETLVIVTAAPNRRCINEARALGARVREVATLDADTLRDLRLWKNVHRLYLIAEDPVQNESRLRAIDEAMDRLGVRRPRMPLTVRIDDPWQAEVWRRHFLDSGPVHGSDRDHRRWVADAVGRYETTAATILRHMTNIDFGYSPPDAVLICGLFPLTYALTSELAQMDREQLVYSNPKRVLPQRVYVMAMGASGFLADHELRQARIASRESALQIAPLNVEPTVEEISKFVGRNPRGCVVLTDPSMETSATRLAARFQKLTIYVASSSTQTLPESSLVSRIFPFPITMNFDRDAPQDAWERAAELIHEAYRVKAKAENWAMDAAVDRPWLELDPFLKQANRRTVTHTLAVVESIGYTWNTLGQPPAPLLPSNFAELDRQRQFHALDFRDPKKIDNLVRAEHEDWYSFYKRHGWRYSKERDPKKKHHDRLLPWDEYLKDNPTKNEERCQDTVIDALHTLRSLGFRCIPKDTAAQSEDQTSYGVLMADDEFRVEVELNDDEHGYSLWERLRALSLDDEARDRLGSRVTVTRDGTRMLMYTHTLSDALEAQRTAAELVTNDNLTADFSVTRWDTTSQQWIATDGTPASPDSAQAAHATIPDPNYVVVQAYKPEFLRDLGL